MIVGQVGLWVNWQICKHKNCVFHREWICDKIERELKRMQGRSRFTMKKILDYTINKDDMAKMDDREVAELLMYTDRDRKELEVAEKIYWWCVEEINRREDEVVS